MIVVCAAAIPDQGGKGMAPRTGDGDTGHETVVSNLMDLQARLRGDPASLVLPREGRRSDVVTVETDDLSVTTGPQVEADPDRRIEALRRKLESLELEIDAYEQAADEPLAPRDEPPPAADVIGLQHAVEERLAEQ
jgi:hypothetical protein